MTKNYVIKIGSSYRYRRRVPKEVAHLDKRKEVKISLKTKDFNIAQIRANIFNDQIETFWKALVHSGNSNNINEKYEIAKQLAKSHGFAYKTSDQIAASTLNEITERLAVKINTKEEAEAILGGIDKPQIKLSECCDLYWDLVADRLINKSENQIRKWKNPRKAAIRDFISIIGNKLLVDVTRRDILKFRSFLNERIQQGLNPNSANKKLMHVKDIIKVVCLDNEIEMEVSTLFIETSFREKVNSRPPYEAEFVEKKLLPNLKTLNEKDRAVLWIMADTGMREKEIFGLSPNDIFLDEEIPFIWIRERNRYELKTPHSTRKIPLVGIALEAFRLYPKGFQSLGNAENFSNTVNKYLKENNLRPTERHSAYSLRHTFKDRLRDIEAPEEIIDELMGHKKVGPKYGRGHKLETKHKWLERIAFRILTN